MGNIRMPNNFVVCFLHIPKSGGTSVREIFGGYFGKSVFECYWASGGRTIENLLWLKEEEKKDISCLFGHYFFGTERLINKKALYMTIMRETVPRIISHYLFHARTLPNFGNDHKATLLKMLSAKDFQYNNTSSRMISGVGNRNIPEDEILEIALKNITNDFIFVGTIEDVLVEKKLKEKLDAFCKGEQIPNLRNLNAREKEYSDVHAALIGDTELVEAIIARNSADQRLYNLISKRVD